MDPRECIRSTAGFPRPSPLKEDHAAAVMDLQRQVPLARLWNAATLGGVTLAFLIAMAHPRQARAPQPI
jgi:hypothetical protein